jgi:hypothetical protein
MHGPLNVRLNLLFNNKYETLHRNKQHAKAVLIKTHACFKFASVYADASIFFYLFIYFAALPERSRSCCLITQASFQEF